MRYAVVHADFIRRSPYATAPASAQLAWHHLNVAASEEEAGGVIANCRHFDDRAWMARAGLTSSQVADAIAAKLAGRRGNGLVVVGYDLDRERSYQTSRSNGQQGGRKPKPLKNKANGKNPRVNPPDNPGDSPQPNLSALLPSAPLCSAPPPFERPSRGGGGGSATPAPASLLDLSEPDRIRIVETLTGVHERSQSWIKGSSVNLAELDQYGPSLASLDIEDLKAAYAWFLGQPGRNRGDAHWQKTGHSLHMFVRQGLPAWNDYQKTAETAARLQDQRKADKLREKIERLRKAVEELKAAPPQPCPFHEDPENHEATAPKHLGRFSCLYCMGAELARLQAEPPVQAEGPRVLDIMPPTLNFARGGA